MSTNRSSSSQNARIFTPTVVLQQPSSRMVVTLDGSGAGNYNVDPSIAAGDCIRYNPNDETYYRSQANLEANAEVFGVVESISGNKYNVVVHGSINYPTSRLSAIPSTEDTFIDILFLDWTVPGGLTGEVAIPTGSNIAIVKPVIQVAKHGEFNGVVVNYMGYQMGNAAQLQLGEESVGTLVQTSGNPGENYIDLSKPNQMLTVSENPILYSQFGVKSGVHYVELTMASSANIGSIVVGSTVTQNNPSGNGSIGAVISASGTTVKISRTSSSLPIYNGYCTIGSITFQIIGSSITDFTLPIKTPERLSDGTLMKYWLNKAPLTRVTVPTQLAIDQLEVGGTMVLGNITDLETKITQIESDIALIKTRIGL